MLLCCQRLISYYFVTWQYVIFQNIFSIIFFDLSLKLEMYRVGIVYSIVHAHLYGAWFWSTHTLHWTLRPQYLLESNDYIEVEKWNHYSYTITKTLKSNTNVLETYKANTECDRGIYIMEHEKLIKRLNRCSENNRKTSFSSVRVE